MQEKKPLLIDIEGKPDVVLEKIGAVHQLAKDLGVEVVSQTIRFKCDNPACNFRMEIMPLNVHDFNYCPKCGAKDGTFPIKSE